MFETWEELENSIVNCNKCKLCKTRQNIVFGVGNRNADIMFIGEGPGADEDRLGEPFVGKAGKLMNMAFGIVGIKREEVYIANVVKCRPPANRNPQPSSTALPATVPSHCYKKAKTSNRKLSYHDKTGVFLHTVPAYPRNGRNPQYPDLKESFSHLV